MNERQQSKAAHAAFNELMYAAGVLIEDFDFTACEVASMLHDALHQIQGKGTVN